MSKKSWKGGTLISPVPPVIVTCTNGEENNLLTVAWTGIINSDPPRTYISVRPERYSYSFIEKSGEFTINLMPARYARAVDFCGVRSGRDGDKAKKCGLHYENGVKVLCPMIAESPLSLECRIFEKKELGSHTMFLADIVCCNVEDSLISPSGKLRLDSAELLSYCHGEYFSIGKKLGKFGFSVEKKSSAKRCGKKQGNGK